MSSDVGYFGVELGELTLRYTSTPSDELKLRVDMSIVGDGGFTWRSSKAEVVSSSELTAFKHEASDADSPGATYTVDFSLFEKSSYIDLKSESISSLSNAKVSIKVVTRGLVAPAVAAAPAKGKGAPAAAAPVEADIVLMEALVSLSSLIMSKECVINSPSMLQPPEEPLGSPVEEMNGVSFQSIGEDIDPTRSMLFFRLAADNDMAEYVAGGAMLQWGTANASGLSNRGWGLHMAPLPEPKSKPKVPPTDEEQKTAYLEALMNFIPTQKDVASFTLALQPSNPSAIPLPPIASWTGTMQFDREACGDLPLEEVKNKGELWSISWSKGGNAFIDRGTIRSLLCTLDSGDEQDCGVDITLRKVPAAAAAALEGEEQLASGRLLLSPLAAPGTTNLSDVQIYLTDNDGSAPLFTISLSVSRAFRDVVEHAESDVRPADMSSLHQVGGGTSNRDVYAELRNEIREVIKEVAREYVALYPAAVEGGVQPNKTDLQQRKLHFLHHLTSSGVYHKLKETLKPRIQRAARKRYGAKSRALGLAGSASFDSMAIGAETELPLDQLIGELYVFLVQESNVVLNAMYRETVVDCDLHELEQPAAIDDERETPKQTFKRLSSLAFDAESAGDFGEAEKRHLERIQLLTVAKDFAGDNAAVRAAYSSYALLLLHRAAAECRVKAIEASRNSFSGAREALRIALNAESGDSSSDWEFQLDMGILLIELGQHEEGYEMLQRSIDSQLREQCSFDNFDGYESDKLCPVNPLCYVFLSVYFLEQNKPLSARKATRLAIRSYAEGGYTPPYSEHGKPKRTATLAFATGALYAHERGLNRLGSLCMRWAQVCDKAATDKAEARNLPADSPPMIRHLLKRSAAVSLHSKGDDEAALVSVKDSITVATNKSDIIEGYVCYIKILTESGGEAAEIRENFIKAIGVASSLQGSNKDSFRKIPLYTFIDCGRVLLGMGKYLEAVDLMLLGCSVYASCSLFLLVGICCLRLDRMQDAEDALEEANLIDNRNADVWAYLTLLCVSDSSGKRLTEGARCLEQALRLGLVGAGSVALYRELALAHMAVDKLSTAEDLLRRGLKVEQSLSAQGKVSAYTRKLLGDVLVGQNLAAVAVDEYRAVIGDEEAPVAMRLEACENCITLLSSLGRDEEIRSLAAISDSLKTSK